jgi:hypothetical protein
MGTLGKRMKELFISSVTAPVEYAAGSVTEGKGEGAAGPNDGVEVNVLTTLTSVFIGKVLMLRI